MQPMHAKPLRVRLSHEQQHDLQQESIANAAHLEVRKVAQVAQVQLELAVVHGVEADQRCVQPPVCESRLGEPCSPFDRLASALSRQQVACTSRGFWRDISSP